MDMRHENFLRIAEKRTNKIISMVKLLGNLNNKSFYDFSEKEIDDIFFAIQEELDKQYNSFKSKRKVEKFKL